MDSIEVVDVDVGAFLVLAKYSAWRAEDSSIDA